MQQLFHMTFFRIINNYQIIRGGRVKWTTLYKIKKEKKSWSYKDENPSFQRGNLGAFHGTTANHWK
jgi:hypothetical protein